jgi:hypothetical protein
VVLEHLDGTVLFDAHWAPPSYEPPYLDAPCMVAELGDFRI